MVTGQVWEQIAAANREVEMDRQGGPGQAGARPQPRAPAALGTGVGAGRPSSDPGQTLRFPDSSGSLLRRPCSRPVHIS